MAATRLRHDHASNVKIYRYHANTSIDGRSTDPLPEFHANLFEPAWLQSAGAITGLAEAGRGSTYFLKIAGQELVLRQYRRGGWVRHLSTCHYVWLGLERTRALHEFQLLTDLYTRGLPVPQPYACEVIRRGLVYSASLMTCRIPGDSLAERILGNTIISDEWHAVGECVALFHAHGVWHADLNAHNVLLDVEQGVSLLDFDKAQIKSVRKKPWMQQNIMRLQRSVQKICEQGSIQFPIDGWAELEAGYANS